MANINMLSPDAIRTFALEVDRYSQEITSASNAINGSITTLIPTHWKSDSSTTFASQWERDYAEFQKKAAAFAELVSILNSVANDIEATEQQNVARAVYH